MSIFQQIAAPPLSLRQQYLTSLPEPQEWFLEERVRSGETWAAPDQAYAVFHKDTLVEFHSANSNLADRHLSSLMRHRPFEKALGKSFDHVLMETARLLEWDLHETGYLFRKRIPSVLKKRETFHMDQAKPADLSQAWALGQGFFDSRQEVDQLFRSRCLWIACDAGQMVGCGVMIPIDNSEKVVDIGMVTRSDQRNKGFGSLIVAELANTSEAAGKRPVCGCAQSNPVSKAALEKAGFVAEHRLVRLNIPD